MTVSTLPRSEQPLSDLARHLVWPSDRVVDSVWPRVRARLATVGVQFDRWQDGLAMVTLGVDAGGRYASTVGGVTASICRQTGKTFSFGNILVGLAAEFPGLRAAWTSHHNRTTTNTFRSMQGLVSRPRMKPLLAPNGIRTANGEQEIRFRNGSTIMFGAREFGFGRGLDEIDVLVFDEAQILTLKALEDMVATTNQARHEHGALLFYLGTPPRPHDPGEAFASKRRAALDGDLTSGVFVEFSADPDADPDDRAQWAKANPSYPHRTPEESMLRMRENLPDMDSWRREGLGIWDALASDTAIDPDLWAVLEDVEDERPSPIALGVAMSQDRRWTSIGLAGRRSDELIQLQIVESGRGGEWVAERLAELKKWKPVGPVLLRAGAPEASLAPALKRARVKHRLVSQRDYAGGCGVLLDEIGAEDVQHAGQPLLNIAAGAARKRDRGELWVWDEPDGTDISPLHSVTLAHLALSLAPERPRTPTRVTVLR